MSHALSQKRLAVSQRHSTAPTQVNRRRTCNKSQNALCWVSRNVPRCSKEGQKKQLSRRETSIQAPGQTPPKEREKLITIQRRIGPSRQSVSTQRPPSPHPTEMNKSSPFRVGVKCGIHTGLFIASTTVCFVLMSPVFRLMLSGRTTSTSSSSM